MLEFSIYGGITPAYAGSTGGGLYGIIWDYRITPAYAGSTKSKSTASARKEDHPRLRGEYVFATVQTLPVRGSPPLTRGVRLSMINFQWQNRITPAYAGSTNLFSGFQPYIEDHPRLRGEYVYSFPDSKNCQGSPPLTRGVL